MGKEGKIFFMNPLSSNATTEEQATWEKNWDLAFGKIDSYTKLKRKKTPATTIVPLNRDTRELSVVASLIRTSTTIEQVVIAGLVGGSQEKELNIGEESTKNAPATTPVPKEEKKVRQTPNKRPTQKEKVDKLTRENEKLKAQLAMQQAEAEIKLAKVQKREEMMKRIKEAKLEEEKEIRDEDKKQASVYSNYVENIPANQATEKESDGNKFIAVGIFGAAKKGIEWIRKAPKKVAGEIKETFLAIGENSKDVGEVVLVDAYKKSAGWLKRHRREIAIKGGLTMATAAIIASALISQCDRDGVRDINTTPTPDDSGTPGPENPDNTPEIVGLWPTDAEKAAEFFGLDSYSNNPNNWELTEDGAWHMKADATNRHCIYTTKDGFVAEGYYSENSEEFGVVTAGKITISVREVILRKESGLQEAKEVWEKAKEQHPDIIIYGCGSFDPYSNTESAG